MQVLSKDISEPTVSVCVPTYNGEEWLRECLDSALAQTYGNIEVLVVDDNSTDRTLEIARSYRDARVRLHVNARTRGLAGNWNECVRLARGEYVKFLFQDDILYPTCVEKMVRLFSAHQNLGMVFAPRDLLVEGGAEEEVSRRWLRDYETLHTRFDVRPGVNDGRSLFSQHLARRFQFCAVGEPTTVLIKKECFERLGLFNTRIHQACDVEMWLRIMYFYDIGFIDENLSAFRFHARSTSASNRKNLSDLHDPFWLLEGLLSHEEIGLAHPEISGMRDGQVARNSLLRPSNGWRSLTSAEGFRAALGDAALLPRRVGFLTTYVAHRLRKWQGRSRLREQL